MMMKLQSLNFTILLRDLNKVIKKNHPISLHDVIFTHVLCRVKTLVPLIIGL